MVLSQAVLLAMIQIDDSVASEVERFVSGSVMSEIVMFGNTTL